MNPQRLDIDFLIQWDGRWLVGSGQGTARADHLVQRRRYPDPRDPSRRLTFPFVPGSEIKVFMHNVKTGWQWPGLRALHAGPHGTTVVVWQTLGTCAGSAVQPSGTVRQ